MMRSVLYISFSLFIIGVFGEDVKPKNSIEDNVLSLLTKWRTGNTKNFLFPLPSLEVIKMAPVSGTFEGVGARISYSTNKLVITGLNQFSVEQLDIVESTLNASALLTVPVLSITSDKYNINGRAFLIPISGSGQMTINMRRIRLQISIRLRSNDTYMWVDDLLLSFRVGSLVANLEGGPSAIVLLLNTSGVNIIQGYHDDIVRTLKALVVPAIDKFLAGNSVATPKQLFQLAKDIQTAPSVIRV